MIKKKTLVIPKLMIEGGKRLPALVRFIIKEAKPDEIEIDPKAQTVKLKYKRD